MDDGEDSLKFIKYCNYSMKYSLRNKKLDTGVLYLIIMCKYYYKFDDNTFESINNIDCNIVTFVSYYFSILQDILSTILFIYSIFIYYSVIDKLPA